jgi:hypothetical protein
MILGRTICGQCYKTYLRNKLECLSLASRSSLVYCLLARLGAYPRVEHLKGSSIGQALVYKLTLG